LFATIDVTLPNPALVSTDVTFVYRSMADELASVIVGFPLFLLVTWWIVRDFQRQPERLESPVWKWLTYPALVITASTVIGDVVTLLAYFLRATWMCDLCLRSSRCWSLPAASSPTISSRYVRADFPQVETNSSPSPRL
jgi:hypothetical protein